MWQFPYFHIVLIPITKHDPVTARLASGKFTSTQFFLFIQVLYLMKFGLSNEDVGRLLAFRPELMRCSIEERWKPLVKYLYYLGVSKDGMRRILTIKPMVFCADLESTIVPKVCFHLL